MSQRVLIVDDLADVRYLLRVIIEKGGHTIVAEAADGAEAVKRYREHQPDITIMDIDMPVKSGIEASRDIRNINRNARIIICSAGTVNNEDSLLLESIGVNNIINKPFKISRLFEAMQI